MLDEQEDESLGVEQLPQAELDASPGSNNVQANPDTDAPNANQSEPEIASELESHGTANAEEESKP